MKSRAAIIIIRGGEVLLMHRRKPGKDYYVLPGGKLKAWETLEEACLREAWEETGLTVTLDRKVAQFAHKEQVEHYFLAGHFTGTPAIRGPEQFRHSAVNSYELEWVGREKLQQINFKPASMRELVLFHIPL